MHTKLHAAYIAIGLALAGAGAQAGPWVATAIGELNGVAGSPLATGVNDRGEVIGVVGTTVGRPGFLYSGGNIINLGAGFQPQAINNLGQVVGLTSAGSGATSTTSTTVHSGGVQTTVGPSGSNYFFGALINNNGAVAGALVSQSASAATGGTQSAALVSGGVVVDIGVLGGDQNSFATGINDTGTVIGRSTATNSFGTTFEHAFVYSNGVLTNLGSLGGGLITRANAINADGTVVGQSGRLDGSQGAFIYSQGVMTDLGTLNIDPTSRFRSESAADINKGGWVVGTSRVDSNHARGFLFNGQSLTDLGSLGGSGNSEAYAINDAGQVLGKSLYTSAANVREDDYFVWESGVMLNLDDLVAGLGIGDVSTAHLANGYIAGIGKASDGSLRSFLLSQVQPDTHDVPEPTTLALVALALFGAARAGSRR